MQIASCRDPKNDARLLKTENIIWGFLSDAGSFAPLTLTNGMPFTYKSTLAKAAAANKAHAVILVHGFNTDQLRLRDAYHSIRRGMQGYLALGPDSVYGFSWPAQSGAAPWHYWAAFNNSMESGRRLRQMILDLKNLGYNRVTIVCHSMGSILVMNMLKSIESGLIHEVIIHGGDAAWSSFSADAHYGQACANKIHRLASYYSAGDEVLQFVAKMVRPVERVGERELPGDKPSNYFSIDAQKLHGAEVDHSTYANSGPILRDTAMRIGS